MFLALEKFAFFLQHHHDVDIQGLVLLGLGGVVGVLHKLASVGTVGFHIHAVLDKLGVEVFDAEELACAVHHGLRFAILVDHLQGRYASGGSDALVVGTEGRGNMDDTCTIFSGDIVARDDAESAFARVDPRNELFVFDADKVFALEFLHDFGRFLEHGLHQGFGHEDVTRFLGVGMHGLQKHIVDIRTDAEGSVARQGPRCGRPRNSVCRAVTLWQPRIRFQFEQRHTSQILHVAVAAGHVQLVRAEAGARSRGVGLDGVALIEQTFVVQVFEQEPQGLDVVVGEGDVGVVEVDPITHLTSEVVPHVLVFHHLLAAGAVVVVNRNLLADVFLGDAKFLLYAEFDGQAMGVPTGLADDMLAFQGLVAAHHILDGAGHHMVDAWGAIGTRWAFEEHEGIVLVAVVKALLESVVLFPILPDSISCLSEIQLFIFLVVAVHTL